MSAPSQDRIQNIRGLWATGVQTIEELLQRTYGKSAEGAILTLWEEWNLDGNSDIFHLYAILNAVQEFTALHPEARKRLLTYTVASELPSGIRPASDGGPLDGLDSKRLFSIQHLGGDFRILLHIFNALELDEDVLFPPASLVP